MWDDWRRVVKIIGVGFAAFVLPLFFLFVGYGLGISSGYYDAQADGYAAQVGTASHDRIERCFREPDTTIAATRECVEQAVRATREEQRSEQDLNAQRQMAQWAWWLLIATIAQMPLTVAGLVLLLQTIRQGQEGLSKAHDANKITEDAARRQLRAYLCIRSLTIELKDWENDEYSINMLMLNNGVTPATITKIVMKVYWIYKADENLVIVDADAKIRVRCHKDIPMNIPYGFKGGFKGADKPGFVLAVGRVEYRDEFGAAQRESFGFSSERHEAFVDYEFPFAMLAYPIETVIEMAKERKKGGAKAAPEKPS